MTFNAISRPSPTTRCRRAIRTNESDFRYTSHAQKTHMQCFLCASSEPPLYRMCKCDSLVHSKCFERLVCVPSHSTHCAVCKAKYDVDITYRRRVRLQRSWRVWSMAVVSVSIVGLTAGIMLCTYTELQGQWVLALFVAAAILFIFFCAMSGMLCALNVRMSQSICCVSLKEEPVHRVINLPRAEVALIEAELPAASSSRAA